MCAPTLTESVPVLVNINSFILSAFPCCKIFPGFLISPGHLCVVLEKKAVLQQQVDLLLTALPWYICQCFLLLCHLVQIFSGLFYSLPCRPFGNADHFCRKIQSWGMSHYEQDRFLFSICSLRSWHCRSPVSLRSLQPYSTKSGRLHIASRFLYLNCWVCRSKIQDPTVQIPSHPPISPPTEKLHLIYSRGKRKSHLTSAQTVFYYKQEGRMEKS